MTAYEAYEILCEYCRERFVVGDACREYDDFFGFFVKPEGTDPDARTYVGAFMFCVDKNTKRVYTEEICELRQKRFRFVPIIKDWV